MLALSLHTAQLHVVANVLFSFREWVRGLRGEGIYIPFSLEEEEETLGNLAWVGEEKTSVITFRRRSSFVVSLAN